MSEFSEFYGRVVAGPVFGLTPGGKPCAYATLILHDGAVTIIRSSSPNGLEALERAGIGDNLCGNGRRDDERSAIDARFLRQDDGWDAP